MTLESVHESISMLRREIFAQFEDLKSRMTPAAASVEFVHEGMDLLIDKRLAATLTLTSKMENQVGDSKVGSLEQSGILEAVIPSFALHLKTITFHRVSPEQADAPPPVETPRETRQKLTGEKIRRNREFLLRTLAKERELNKKLTTKLAKF
ncbi:unnamed protein product [Cyprideis torosa]|uniref:Uncharacterized protein n=1 Tax=Cyprideis torosa TaxID=163714 RepID=A0A7R8WI36_9CRUS|nr:unnamed protein product [Cyprideis torosa]CAG0900215.1 unnamed protein product [Cyprideis torosa]